MIEPPSEFYEQTADGSWREAFTALVRLCEREGYLVGTTTDGEVHFLKTPLDNS